MGILRYPLATEKAFMMIEKSNTITYIVNMDATKAQIKNEFEKMFGVKLASVRAETTPLNYKKAFLKLTKAYKASEVAEKLKLV